MNKYFISLNRLNLKCYH